MRGNGRGFAKALPFQLGTNGGMVDFGIDSTGIADAAAIGMRIYRNDVPWNYTKGGGFSGIESAPGTYNAANIATVANVAAALKTAGLTPLFVITVNQAPGLCPVTGADIPQGSTGNVTLPVPGFGGTMAAITAGDSLVLTDPANQAHTQTVTAAASSAKGAASISVNPFTANFDFPAGTWIYDTAWPACTPQHLADMMTHLVGQPGLQGLHWELFNEPDGIAWNVSAAQVAQTYQLAHAAMKAADPTCVVHGICIENLAPLGFPEGTTYYNSCVTAGILGTYDILSFHQYGNNPNGTTLDCPPDAPNTWGEPYWQMIAAFQHNRIAKGDTTPMWCTEFGWRSAGDGAMTPQLQAQFFQNLLVVLSGKDPVNGVPFSDYLKAMLQFQMTGTFQNWSLIDSSTGPKPSYGVLGELVAGH
jgi:hypothetical protein